MNQTPEMTASRDEFESSGSARLQQLRERMSVTKRRSIIPRLAPRPRRDTYPLSYAQERLWFLEQTGLLGTAYSIPMALHLNGQLDVSALERSIAEIIGRHEILRARIRSIDGAPMQVIERDSSFTLEVTDLSEFPEAIRANELERISRSDAETPFNLSDGPLFRASLIRFSDRRHVLLMNMHHIVSDGWSLGILNRELSALYLAHANGQPSPLPHLPIQYLDYAIWQRDWMAGEELERHLHYWRGQLRGLQTLDLPSDRNRPEVSSYKGDVVDFTIPPKLALRLRELAGAQSATLFMVLLSVMSLLLSQYSGSNDVVIGCPIAGRSRQEIEGLIGFFSNTLAIRADLSSAETFRQLIEHMKAVTLDAYAHQELPFERVVAELNPNRSLARQPIFQVMMMLHNFPQSELDLSGLSWNWLDRRRPISKFDMSWHFMEGAEGLTGAVEYAIDLFDRGTICRMVESFRTILGHMLTRPDRPIKTLPLITEGERRQVTQVFNETGVKYREELLIHQLFEEQVKRTPDAVAIEHEGRCLTYAELNGRANRLARHLLGQGVGPDQVVGIFFERGFGMVVGILGILKAGGAYLPLDPSYPAERLQQMLEDAAPRLVLTETDLRGMLPATEARVIALNEKLEELSDVANDLRPAELGLSSQNLVYVIYTSGSTGRPKGTAMRHCSVVNLIEWHRGFFGNAERLRVLQFAALSFDVAFQEIFSTICTGGTLVLIDEWGRRDAAVLTDFLCNGPIHRLFVPPLMLQSIAEHCKTSEQVPSGLKEVITAGEQLRITPEIKHLFKRLNGCRLHNHYGPTETHVVTALTLAEDPAEWPDLPSIGRPIANARIYLLDRQMRPVPIGVVGEIYIGGAGVARGYLNHPELTEQRFLSDPYSTDPRSRLYRTGDLGRWRSDGTLEYLGRNDHQVKIRGFRVELGEIEAQLLQQEQVKQATVIAREDEPHEKRLVAYVVPANGCIPRVEALQAHLKAALPEHMVPSAFVMLEALPLTPSGKLDRQALPAPDRQSCSSRHFEAPQGEIEEALAEIWQELLRVERIGRNDNFFELGGHSLQIMRLISRIYDRCAVLLTVPVIFQRPTVALLAQSIAATQSAAPTTDAVHKGELEFDEGVL
jgi:amino acid adenylation domain-containing protein